MWQAWQPHGCSCIYCQIYSFKQVIDCSCGKMNIQTCSHKRMKFVNSCKTWQREPPSSVGQSRWKSFPLPCTFSMTHTRTHLHNNIRWMLAMCEARLVIESSWSPEVISCWTLMWICLHIFLVMCKRHSDYGPTATWFEQIVCVRVHKSAVIFWGHIRTVVPSLLGEFW